MCKMILSLCTVLLLFQLVAQVSSQTRCLTEGYINIDGSDSSFSQDYDVGRVRYCYNFEGTLYWAAVCNSGWAMNEAHVACRTLDPDAFAVTTLPGELYSTSNLGFYVNVDCKGNEASIANCTVTRNPLCNQLTTAGVSCNRDPKPFDAITVGGPSDTEGNIMIYDGHSWHFLYSHNDFWNGDTASTACRQMGYTGGAPSIGFSTAGFGPYVANFQCSSGASALVDCSINTGSTGSIFLASVECYTSGDADFSVKLVDGAERSGTVIVTYKGRLGHVCSIGFSEEAANTVCRQLGHGDIEAGGIGSASIVTSTGLDARSRYSSKPVWIDFNSCDSEAQAITECSYERPGTTTCTGGSVATVSCKARQCSPGEVRLDGSNSPLSPHLSSGRVRYCHSVNGTNSWLAVCNSRWAMNEAHVACRTLASYAFAIRTIPGNKYSISDTSGYVDIECNGDEASISDCVVTPSLACNQFLTAGVSCNRNPKPFDAITVGGSSDTEGNVMIYEGSFWHVLYSNSDFWNGDTASTACKQMGYTGGAPSVGFSVSNPGSPLKVNFQCSSGTTALIDCSVAPDSDSPQLVASVQCYTSGDPDLTVKLVEGTDRSGVVAVTYRGRLGHVCSHELISNEAANAVCRQLGHGEIEEGGVGSTSPTIGAGRDASSRYSSKPVWIASLSCSPEAASISACSYAEPLGTECSGEMVATVNCKIRPLSPGEIAAIVLSCVIIVVVLITLCCCYPNIKESMIKNKKKVKHWWNNRARSTNRTRPAHRSRRENIETTTSGPAPVESQPNQELNNTKLVTPPSYDAAGRCEAEEENGRPPPYLPQGTETFLTIPTTFSNTSV